MSISTNDITFTFSGGSFNNDPEQSLGGEPSVQPILDKRLFSNISQEQSASGFMDYRCFYLNNDNISDAIFNAKLYVSYIVPGDVTVKLGFISNNERQTFTILDATAVTGGSVDLTYIDADSEYDVAVAWNADFAVWTNNLQTALQSIPNLEDVVVNAIQSDGFSGSNLIFEINFLGSSSMRFHDLIVVKTNSLSPATTIGVTRTISGGPINSAAGEIDVSTTIPYSVNFIETSYAEPFLIGDLRPLDSIPVWVRRTVPIGSVAIENDSFTFRLSGNPIP